MSMRANVSVNWVPGEFLQLDYCLASADDCRMLDQVGDGVNPAGEIASLRIGGIHRW
jgi:hypothetical protein